MDESITPKELAAVFKMIEEDKDQMLSWLKDLVAVPTISAEKEHRKDIMRLINQTQEKLKKHGVHVILEPLGDQKLSDGSQVPFPPLLVASTNHDPKRKTLCLYGHLDVQAAHKGDGWETEPFQPVEKDGRLYGRGAAHNKGPLTACIWALCAFLQSAGRPPLNVRLLIDSMQEVDSQGVAAYLQSDRKSAFLKDIDYVCISDGVWLGPRIPCLTYALRGTCHFQIEVTCARVDLHSGIYGGTAIEAMPDLMYLLNSLTDSEGRMKVPGIYDDVLPLTHEERKFYDGVEFDIEAYRQEMGVTRMTASDKTEILMRQWRYPSLSVHGVEGAHWSPGDKAVIPGRVVGKFSIRTVPNQTAQKVRHCVEKHLQTQFSRRGSPNRVKVIMSHYADTWVGDPNRPHFEAAEAAVKHAYGVAPHKTRGGFSIGVARPLQQHVCRDVLVMSINPAGCGFHSQNEHISITDLVSGAKLFAAYMYELSKLK